MNATALSRLADLKTADLLREADARRLAASVARPRTSSPFTTASAGAVRTLSRLRHQAARLSATPEPCCA